MSDYLWKYGIETQLHSGEWRLGIVWACPSNQFRALLSYVNGECNPSNERVVPRCWSPTRIRRMPDNERAEFTWPQKN